jgi:restriction system protein
MGGMNFAPGTLADYLSEAAGYKAGLALSIPELCDHLSGTEYPDIILRSEDYGARLRSEEYEALFYKLLHRIGYTTEEYDGDYTGAKRFHKYRRKRLLRQYEGMHRIFNEMWMGLLKETTQRGSKSIDPTPFIMKCHEEFGIVGVKMAVEQVEVLNKAVLLSPHSICRAVEWLGPLALNKLFAGTGQKPELGKFIDQRFLDYLSANADRLADVHWRKFEELTAEFFHREGFEVALGPGSNDEGVDVRVWRPGAEPTAKPLCLVQCKRQKAKVEKVIVKGLYADVEHEGADYGVVVTTSELAPGARATIAARGYPIREVEQQALRTWLLRLRTPGTGVVRA